jgi:hypothetical protein
LGRQTDGLRRVVSNHAIFDRYLGFHFELLSTEKRTKAPRDGQEVQRWRRRSKKLAGCRGDGPGRHRPAPQQPAPPQKTIVDLRTRRSDRCETYRNYFLVRR